MFDAEGVFDSSLKNRFNCGLLLFVDKQTPDCGFGRGLPRDALELHSVQWIALNVSSYVHRQTTHAVHSSELKIQLCSSEIQIPHCDISSNTNSKYACTRGV